jgi:hypothetical protein
VGGEQAIVIKEEVSVKVEDPLEMKEEDSIKFEETIDEEEEMPDATSVPPVQTEPKVRLCDVCDLVVQLLLLGHSLPPPSLQNRKF